MKKFQVEQILKRGQEIKQKKFQKKIKNTNQIPTTTTMTATMNHLQTKTWRQTKIVKAKNKRKTIREKSSETTTTTTKK